MKHKIIGSLVAASLLASAASAGDTLMERFEKMEKEMAALKAEIETLKAKNSALSTQLAAPAKDEPAAPATASAGKVQDTLEDIQDQLDDLNKRTRGNNLKWGVDFRTSIDNIHYKMADGSSVENDALISNRLWLDMSYAATKQLSFVGQLAYNKTFGQRSAISNLSDPSFEGFDWISSESAYDDTLRVRSAYFFYTDDELAGLDMPWTFSIGRRPSTNGHLINFRDDVSASSPLAHTVNVEFDGASAKFGMEELTGLHGSYLKLCAGRGMSKAEPMLGTSTPYSGDGAVDTKDIDMGGIIIVPYDDKQYSTGFQYTYANNLIDITDSGMATNTGGVSSGIYNNTFETVGGLHTATAFAMVNGIGDDISDFLDNTMIFVSGAMTKTDPYSGKTMLGSDESKTGYSYWIGTQFPSLISDEGRWGMEFNHGSKYWRPITYAEDTMVGSKLAVRGNTYELYFTEPLVKDILTFQLRYTYLDYDYTGSNGFFGTATGMPMSLEDAVAAGMGSRVVDKAQDIRAYIRYKF